MMRKTLPQMDHSNAYSYAAQKAKAPNKPQINENHRKFLIC